MEVISYGVARKIVSESPLNRNLDKVRESAMRGREQEAQ
jgi:hypothetical protein